MSELAAKAQRLLDAHHSGEPLLLLNAWDVVSATAVADTGLQAVATSSHAIAEMLGHADDDSGDPNVIFALTASIARAVPVPVTADLEAGYRLPAVELVNRILDAGVVGCNLEDSDHHGDGVLIAADRQAARLAEVRAAADARGVHLVINARVDTFIRRAGDQTDPVAEAVRRARLYLEAGADCVYPIAVSRAEDAAALVEEIPGPVNLLAHRGGLSITKLTELGASRISLGAGLFNLAAERFRIVAGSLAAGSSLDEI